MTKFDELLNIGTIDHLVIEDDAGRGLVNQRGTAKANPHAATISVAGHLEIRDAQTGDLVLSQHNDIHPENISNAIALSLSNRGSGHIHMMAFGNGASTVSGTGGITYYPPNVEGFDAQLYNETYSKIVDDSSPSNSDPDNNKMQVAHVQGQKYTDIITSCILDFGEPSGQEAFDDAVDNEGEFVFDEMGLKSLDPDTAVERLLTHVIFHPVQKSLNRALLIKYTIRILMV